MSEHGVKLSRAIEGAWAAFVMEVRADGRPEAVGRRWGEYIERRLAFFAHCGMGKAALAVERGRMADDLHSMVAHAKRMTRTQVEHAQAMAAEEAAR